MGLRPYQADCLTAIARADNDGCRAGLVVMPCGGGKSKIIGNLPTTLEMRPWERMAVLVHMEELAAQMVDAVQRENPGLRVGLEKASSRADPDCDIVVASIPTLARSPDRLDQAALRIVAVDECHHSPSPAWMQVLRNLHVLKGEDNRDPDRRLYGVSATPRRADGLALECVFDRIVYRKGIREMIAEGWLCEPVGYRVMTDADLDTVKMRGGDFAIGELSRTMNTPTQNALVVKKYLEYGSGLPALVYTVDIQHSNDIAATFREHGLHFEAVSSNTPPERRKEIIDAFRKGEILGLCSCQALLEAFDAPIATVALFDRPTCSGLLYQQALGRVMRCYPAPEAAATHTGYFKEHAIIVDFVGASAKHRLYTAATLFGLNPAFDMQGRSITKTLAQLEEIQEQNPTLDITAFAGLADVEAAVNRVDLWTPPAIPKLAKSCSAFIWTADGEDRYRLAAPGMSVFIEVDHLGQYNVHRQVDKQPPDGHMTFTEPEDAFALADSLVPDEVVPLIRSKARWRKDPPSEAQCSHLWFRDPVIKKRFPNGETFHRFALGQLDKGNSAFSKGALSMRINLCKRAREKAKAVTK